MLIVCLHISDDETHTRCTRSPPALALSRAAGSRGEEGGAGQWENQPSPRNALTNASLPVIVRVLGFAVGGSAARRRTNRAGTTRGNVPVTGRCRARLEVAR